MSLLEKLVEKKDIDAYCRLRKARLREEISCIDKVPEKMREKHILRLHSRIY